MYTLMSLSNLVFLCFQSRNFSQSICCNVYHTEQIDFVQLRLVVSLIAECHPQLDISMCRVTFNR